MVQRATAPIENIEPSGNLSHAATRHLELISNDHTNLYQSLLGNSLVRSISDFNISQVNATVSPTEGNATIAGLTNSVVAIMDDVLGGYSSAQLEVGNSSRSVEAVITTLALRIGQGVYIWAALAIDFVVAAAMVWRF